MSGSGLESLSFAHGIPDPLNTVVPVDRNPNINGVAPKRRFDVDSAQAVCITSPRLLYVDDQVDTALLELLGHEGFHIQVAQSGREALDMAIDKQYAAVVLDLHLPDMFGLSLLDRLIARKIHAPVLVVTGCYGEEEMEHHALQAGAAAFRRKPLWSDEVAAVLRDIIARSRRPDIAVAWEGTVDDDAAGFIADSSASRELTRWIARVGPSSVPVLITGESGVGKELAARALHRASMRRRDRFVPLNCGAIPDGLLESELFGHAKGGFTGAVADKPGLLEVAHEGTVFLDEIAELPASMQVRLLRALENGEIRRVGETRTRHVDARIKAATNRSIHDELQAGRFRQDLYFRLAVATYNIPPLRDRPEEIEPLARYWLKRLAVRQAVPVTDISPAALTILRTYRWPGNVRELRNTLERAIVWTVGPTLTEREISGALSSPVCGTSKTIDQQQDSAQQSLAALEAHHWNRSAAARSLGIDRTTLWRRLKRLREPGRRNSDTE